MTNNGVATEKYYYERQHFAVWVYVVLGGVGLAGIMPLLFDRSWMRVDHTVAGIIAGLSIAAVVPVCVNVLRMHTTVTNDRLYIRFGLFFPMLWKRIRIDSVEESRVITYRPLRDAGGWGWRYGKYEGHSGWFFNARGNRGVLIITCDKRRFIVGSQQPEALDEAIQRARANRK